MAAHKRSKKVVVGYRSRTSSSSSHHDAAAVTRFHNARPIPTLWRPERNCDSRPSHRETRGRRRVLDDSSGVDQPLWPRSLRSNRGGRLVGCVWLTPACLECFLTAGLTNAAKALATLSHITCCRRAAQFTKLVEIAHLTPNLITTSIDSRARFVHHHRSQPTNEQLQQLYISTAYIWPDPASSSRDTPPNVKQARSP